MGVSDKRHASAQTKYKTECGAGKSCIWDVHFYHRRRKYLETKRTIIHVAKLDYTKTWSNYYANWRMDGRTDGRRTFHFS